MTNSPKLSLLDSAMLIMGSMIGSGIFIVSAAIARDVQTPGLLLLAWVVTGIITIFGALSYGELAAMMPQAGGQYVYLKEAYNPMSGFLYGWTLFAVIQTGTIAAVGVAFAKFTGVFLDFINEKPVVFLGFFSLSTQQLLGMACVLALTFLNFRDVKTGALVQNLFTFAKIGAVLLMIGLGIFAAFQGKGSWQNFSPAFPQTFSPGMLGIFGAALVGSLFSSDAWNNITFTAGEVKNPQRNLPLSLLIGTGAVTLLYLAANLVYVYLLPISQIQNASSDRVGTLLMQNILGNPGGYFMAAMIMISTFGCLNGLILSGGRVYFAMAKDKLFFPKAGQLNKNGVPANALAFQGVWACLLTLTGRYNDLLDFVIFAVLIFYILTVAAVFVLRQKRPEILRPYRTFGYPVVPGLYILLALGICVCLLIYKPEASFSGLGIVLIGIPVYFLLNRNRQT
jgi:basic amino acid/polyamine antiporter, APA family